jgi:uncharacterized FlaG/YvyC family protein
MDIKVGSVSDSPILRDDLRKRTPSTKKATRSAVPQGVTWEAQREFRQEEKEPNWLERIVRDFNDMLSLFDVCIGFVCEKEEEIQVKIVNTETGETIRKVPPQTILGIVEKLLGMVNDSINQAS